MASLQEMWPDVLFLWRRRGAIRCCGADPVVLRRTLPRVLPRQLPAGDASRTVSDLRCPQV